MQIKIHPVEQYNLNNNNQIDLKKNDNNKQNNNNNDKNINNNNDTSRNSAQQVKMTLNQYLQSINLKRRISSRSKQKKTRPILSTSLPFNNNHNNNNNLYNSNIHQHNILPQQPQINLQPPSQSQNNPNLNPTTTQYYKLNQQWKSRKLFSSWIIQLKQLCRQFIKKDDQYVQVVRLIQKISQFVRNQVQMIKRDNLLLESFLVTQASYWKEDGSGGEGNAYNYSNMIMSKDNNNNIMLNNSNSKDTNNNKNVDRLSNYIKAVLSSKSQYNNSNNNNSNIVLNSPTKTTNSIQIKESQQKHHPYQSPVFIQKINKNKDKDLLYQQSIPTNKKDYKTSTQPKSQPTSSYQKHYNNSIHDNNSYSGGKALQSSSLSRDHHNICTIKQLQQQQQSKQQPNTQRQKHYIYSFNDKNKLSINNHRNHQQQHLTHKSPLINTNQPCVKPFVQNSTANNNNNNSINNNNNKNLHISNNNVYRLQNSPQLYQLGLLKIQSRNQQQVLRLSLMSRYDQSKQTLTSLQQKKQQNINNNNNDSQHVTFKQTTTNNNNNNNNNNPYYNKPTPPLRQRKQKPLKQSLTQRDNNYNQQQILQSNTSNQFEMIIIADNNNNINNNNIDQNNQHIVINRHNQSQAQTHNSIKKIKTNNNNYNNNYDDNNNKYTAQASSPSIIRHSPHIINIQTPSTLRRRYPSQQKPTQQINQKQIEQRRIMNMSNSNNHNYNNTNTNTNTNMNNNPNYYNHNKQLSSRQNIMSRYQRFTRNNSNKN